jgi:uncharacterized membrane protein YhhN
MRRMVNTKVLAGAYVALAATDAVLAGRPGKTARRLRYLTKPALMPVLATATRQAGGGRAVTAAQALSWGGDVALLGSGTKAFQGGLGSFLGAHLAYVAGLAPKGERITAAPNAGVKAAGALWLATAPAMAIAARRKDRDLTAPVAAYSTALATMFAITARLDPQLSARGRKIVQTGAALFLLSDTLLGVREFVLKRESPAVERAVMATYTAGQGLIAAGSAHLARHATQPATRP